MRKMFYLNSMFVLIAWCLFLNNLSFLAISLLAAYSISTLKYFRKENFWRIISLSLIISLICKAILDLSNISLYFPMIKYYMYVVSFNAACNYEMLNDLDNNSIYPSYIINCLLLFVFLAIAIILPDAWYSIFTKTNLYLMISLIFLPNAFLATIILLNREFKIKELNIERIEELIKNL